jgi:hypothetical protein
MNQTLKNEIQRLLETIDAADPAAAPRPHLSAEAQSVIAVFAALRKEHRSVQCPGEHLFKRECVTPNVLEELVADGYLADQWSMTCPEGHSGMRSPELVRAHGGGFHCSVCDTFIEPQDAYKKRRLLLDPRVRGVAPEADHVLMRRAIGLLRRVWADVQTEEHKEEDHE